MAKIRRKNKIKQPKQVPKTRKELRKEKRLQKKESKRDFFSRKRKPAQTEAVKHPEIDRAPENESEIESDFEFSDEEIQNKFNKVSSNKKVKKPTVETDRFHENQKRELKKQNELERKMRKRRIEQLKAANEEDDKIIRKLEKKLRIDKHKKVNSVHKMFDDGLNYALELCLPENIEKMYTAAKEAAEIENSDDDFQEDLNNALGLSGKSKGTKLENFSLKKTMKLKKVESKYIQDETDLSGSDSEFQNSDDEDAESEIGGKDSKDSDFDIIDKNGDQSEDDLNSEFSVEEGKEVDNQHSDKSEDAEEMDISEIEGQDAEYEDIYGRTRDKEGNVVNATSGKYIPPHIRAKLEGIDNVDEKRKQKLQQLRRHCKGFLNRLSEANMHKIASDIENLYMNNPRFDMNNTLSDLITEALISNVLSKERMVLEYAMLISILHANVGSEIGAHFLQLLVTKFNTLLKNVETLEVENKELDNIVFVLSHLYSFKIFQHTLIFEIINQLVSNLCEKTVECLLLVLRSIGFQLRKDDPGGLKELIITVQKKANESPLEIKENPRLKFMLDVLNAVKNNNVNKIPQYDPSLVEHLKKILKSMLANGKYIAALNITMEDLLKVDERGKWWVVGSAWSGNINDIGAAKQSSKSKNEQEKFSEKLLALAREQRMNTEDRRSVFCIIMGAEDYVDAFERLLHLAIKDHRVIASVIIHCCLSEKQFNPYYSVLGQKFCEYDRKYQLAVQFALWDRIKDIHSLNKLQISNLAQFLIYLIVNGGLPISVLKVVEFAELDKPTLKLVRQIILGILLGKEEDCIQVFQRIAPSTKLNMFKDSIRLFMHHFLLKDGTKTSVTKDQLSLLKARISIVDRTISFIDSRVDL